MLRINSSININNEIYEKIVSEAEKKGAQVNDFIICLLKTYASNQNKKGVKIFCAIRYQERNPICGWKIHHISYDNVDYEIFTDMRKFFKISVSLLLKLAVIYYFQNVQKPQKRDNYKFDRYEISKKSEQNALFWIIRWRKEVNPLKKE